MFTLHINVVALRSRHSSKAMPPPPPTCSGPETVISSVFVQFALPLCLVGIWDKMRCIGLLGRSSIPYSFVCFTLRHIQTPRTCMHACQTSDATQGASGMNTTAASFAYVRHFPIQTACHYSARPHLRPSPCSPHLLKFPQ